MPIDTNLNVAPYHDDFDPEKNYYKILFRPGVSLQARELTQLQTILQDQIEKFGDNVYRIGSVIKGCSLTTDFRYNYVKILDTQQDGQPVVMSRYNNTLVVQEAAGLSALVVNYKTGFESLDPDLNTLYIKYIDTGSGGEKTFANSQVLTVYDRSRTVEEVLVNNGGSLYSNSDVVVFTSTDGVGAIAEITTDSSGTITDVSVTSKGAGYITAPSVSITTSTGVGASLTAVNYIAQVTVAGSSFAAPVGVGSAVKTTEGVIYQKGHFIRVQPQEELLSKYSSTPDGVSVGFRVVESISNSNIDETLLDLAIGAPNYTAPGANRLKLTPTLTVIDTSLAASNNEFLALLDFEDGNVVKDRTTTQFNSINTELSRRTFEESGNFVIQPFQLDTVEITSNTSHFDLSVSQGIGYVNGNRTEILNTTKTPVRKGTDTANNVNHTTTTAYGNYILVDELLGALDVKFGSLINLRDTPGNDITDNAGGVPSTPGTVIGTARVKSLEYHSGKIGTPTCQYKLYLFDIKMNSGRGFRDVRSVSINGTAVADVVLNAAGRAVLRDVAFDRLVFDSGVVSVKEFTQEDFNFRTSTNATFTTTGSVTISFSGGNTVPYSGNLSSTIKNQFIVIPTQTIYAANSEFKTGVVAANNTVTNVVGTSTAFTADYEIGDYIAIGTGIPPRRIVNIYSDTLLQMESPITTTVSANNHRLSYPSGVPIDFTKGDKIIDATSGTTLNIDLGHSINSTASFVMYHELSQFEPAVRAKTVNNVYVKLSTSKISSSKNGPWCLGIPDVFSIEGVYVGSGNTYSEVTTNFRNQFVLDNGQKDNIYGLSYLRRRPGSSLSLANTNCLLVKLKSFTHGSGKYISTESYPTDDLTTPTPVDKIRTEQIPIFFSPASGESIILGDALDFRPIVANTAILSTSAASASVDPSATETLSSDEKFFPSPTYSFESTVQSYLPRADRIILSEDGVIRVIEGIPDIDPTPPLPVKGAMDLGILYIAPYPSLGAKQASNVGRYDLSNRVILLQTKRFTMRDIGDLERRINQLESVAILTAVESNTVNITIPSESNTQIERFKNGYITDPFNNYNISNLEDGEFKAQIQNSQLVPLYNSNIVDVRFNPILSSNNVVKAGDLVMLKYTDKELFNQPIANKERTLVEDYWNFTGRMSVIPPFDNYFDLDVAGTSAIQVDIATPLNALAKATNDALKKISTNSVVNVSNVINTSISGVVATQTTTSTATTTTTATGISTAPTKTNTLEVGNFLTDISMNQYIRPQKIGVYVSGLRPGAQHYVFMDGVDLTNSTSLALLTNFENTSRNDFSIIGKVGTPLTANTTGELALQIDLPGNTFTTGERDILVMDVSLLNSEESATSKSVGKFSAYNVSGDATRVTFSTKTADTSPGSTFGVQTFQTQKVETKVSTVSWVINSDPLAQTFNIEKFDGSDLIYITKVDLFFRSKDAEKGVTVEIRETDDNGYPTTKILPFSVVRKNPSQVNTSSTAAIATTFIFPSPVGLRVGRDYAVVITPDANSPEYRIWTAETGVPDVQDNSLISNRSWGQGTMFYSVSGRAFTAVQNEDLKFKLYRADFSSLNGNAVIQNADDEFFTVTDVIGQFAGGEEVAQLSNTYIDTTLTTNTGSRVIQTSNNLISTLPTGSRVMAVYGTANVAITGNVSTTGTLLTNGSSITNNNFQANFSNGDFIRIGDSIRQVVGVSNNTTITLDAAPTSTITDGIHYTIEPVFDIFRVESANSTTITVDKVPSVNTSASLRSGLQRVVRGIVTLTNPTDGKLNLTDSNAANSNFRFKTSNSTYIGTIVGETSQATARISSIDNIPAAIFTPIFNTLVTSGTSINFAATLTRLDGSGTETDNYSLAITNRGRFNDSAVIKSKSNEINGTTINKSFTANVIFSSAFSTSSPVFDINPSSLLIESFRVNNDASDENTRYGNATCKYITKKLELAEELDAEDLRLYLTAYKPIGTEVLVYAKVLNSADSDDFDNKDWSLLEQVSNPGVFSNSLDENDLKEYQYTFRQTPTTISLEGVANTYSNSTITGSNTSFDTTFVTGDLVKIVKSSTLTDYDIIPVSTVVSNTVMTLSSNVSFTAQGCTIEKVVYPNEAFKYARNDGAVTYFDSNLATNSTYKFLAIKVVLLSDKTYIVPKLNDIRAIACSV